MSLPCLFMLSSDGFANSHKNDQEFRKTCNDYYTLINRHGAKTVEANLKAWLAETSELGCGDDITLLMAYYYDNTSGSESLPFVEDTQGETEEKEVPSSEQKQ